MISNPLEVFVDADVLAAPFTRTLLLMSAFEAGSGFRPRWSALVEDQANSHVRGSQRRIGDIRRQFEWMDEVLVSDSDDSGDLPGDTDPGDRHVLRAARTAEIGVVVTRNVHHFGEADLQAPSMSAVNPDQFLAWIVTRGQYRSTLEYMAAARSRPPNTVEGLHAAVAGGHPRLFEAMRTAFPGVEPVRSGDRPAKEVFRGSRCIVCGRELDADGVGRGGVGMDHLRVP
ncbi:MAG: PIN domain-containing protein [Bifidobacteriaceae bacterium]|jgi:hypothetical protein|nr:PIN domain-containing protein [Bifidobacteriaceae bacterium]